MIMRERMTRDDARTNDDARAYIDDDDARAYIVTSCDDDAHDARAYIARVTRDVTRA